MGFSRPELDQMSVQLEDDGSVAHDEAQLPKPWFNQALFHGRLEKPNYDLKTTKSKLIKLKLRWNVSP